MSSLRALIAKWLAEKDDQGRAILAINSQEDLEHYIAHPERVPAGDFLIRGRVPLNKDYQRLIEAISKTRKVGTRFGIDAPPPLEIQKSLQAQVGQALDRDLKSAANLPANILEAMRRRASCSDESDGYLLIPFYAGDGPLGRAMFEGIDIHEHGPCPLERWLNEELSAFAPTAERHFGWTKAQLAKQLKLECIGGKIGIEPTLCEIAEEDEQDKFRILVGHVYYHVVLVAARSCAARIWLSEDDPRDKITAKEINDSLRRVVALYDGSDAVPTTDTISANLLPHQVLIVERLAKGLRRFMIAHEMGHALLWKTGGKFDKLSIPVDSLEEIARIAKAPRHRFRAWAEEIACDLIGIKLMQETALAEAGAENEFSPKSHLPLVWDFASIRLWLTLWDHILHRKKLAGQPISDTHPPPGIRMIFVEQAFPSWAQEFGKHLNDMLSHRIANL